MEEHGQLHRINRTSYENFSYTGDENDFINGAAYVPYGVICLMSAARYYGLTNFLPDVVDVAIDRKKKSTRFLSNEKSSYSILAPPAWMPVSQR